MMLVLAALASGTLAFPQPASANFYDECNTSFVSGIEAYTGYVRNAGEVVVTDAGTHWHGYKANYRMTIISYGNGYGDNFDDGRHGAHLRIENGAIITPGAISYDDNTNLAVIDGNVHTLSQRDVFIRKGQSYITWDFTTNQKLFADTKCTTGLHYI